MKTRPLALLALAVTLVPIAVACSGGKKKVSPAEVHDDVYVTGSGAFWILVSGDTAFITNSFDDTIDKVDLTTCTTAQHSCQRTGQATLPTGADPYDLTMLGSKLYVAGFASNKVYVVDPSSMTVTQTIGSNGSNVLTSPESFGSDGINVFVSNANGYPPGPGFISMISGSSVALTIGTSRIQPYGLTPLPDGSLAVVDQGSVFFDSMNNATIVSSGAIDIVDAAGVSRSIPLGLTYPGPKALLTPDHQSFIVPHGVNEAALLKFAEDGSGAPQDLILASSGNATFVSDAVQDGNTIYALSFDEDRVYAVDGASFKSIPVPLASGSVPYLVVGPGGATLKGPQSAALWTHAGRKHLLVVMTISNSLTDIVLP
jgi:YVTN family beta-propeller protein